MKIMYSQISINSKSSGLEVLIQTISCLNYKEIYIKIHKHQKLLLSDFFLLNISFGLVKEKSPMICFYRQLLE